MTDLQDGSRAEEGAKVSPNVLESRAHRTSIFLNRPNRLHSLRKVTASVVVELGSASLREFDDLEELEKEDEGRDYRARFKKSPSVSKFMPSFRRKVAERLVEVRLRNFSYYVPINMDAPSIKTVGNQSIFYVAYLFFRRVHRYLWHSGATLNGAIESGDWLPHDSSDVFIPFEDKAVLHDVNLVLKPGQTYLLLGPPACGKTTLLKAISGLLPNSKNRYGKAIKGKPHSNGRIEFNGVSEEDDPNLVLANVVSFVGQHDNHERYLTVRETFEFAFQCRTGGKHNFGGDKKILMDMDKEKFTENLTLEGLDLAGCADTFVGDENLRGVSGGQRRRVTVGEMMQGQNPVACADEISTGLDAAVTHDIVQSIVDFAKVAMTTRIISLLQPGPETFSLFDEVIVLAEGHVIFAGPIEEADPYFAGLGYKRPPFMEIADFLQSIPTPDGEGMFDPSASPAGKHYTPSAFAEAFKNSEQHRRIVSALDSTSSYSWRPTDKDELKDAEIGSPSTKANVSVPAEFKVLFQNSLWRSFVLNFKRHLTIWWRDKAAIIIKAIQNIAMAVTTGFLLAMVGKVTWTVEDAESESPAFKSQYEKLTDGIYAAFFMTAWHLLGCVNSDAPEDIDSRSIHYKHHDMKFYQCFAFVMGKLISSIPQRVIEIISFGIPLYWIVWLNPTAESFFVYLLILVCYTTALKLMFGILPQVFPKKGQVQGVGLFVLFLMNLFGGYIVVPDAIPGYYKWLYYANPMAWLMQGLASNEFMSQKYENVGVPQDSFLTNFGFESGMEWVWYTFIFMVPFALLCAVILTFVLRAVRIEPERAIVKKRNLVAGHPIHGQLSNEESSKQFNLPFTPVDLTFDKLIYEVKASTSDETLRLLNEVSGVFRAGRMCALMGSSGAGKTTLMDVIAIRKTSGTITGEIKLNGFPQERVSFLRSSGYVEQFDVQQPELNIRETVEFCAFLRLDGSSPSVGGNEGKLKFVDHVLDMMELTEIQKMQVGSFDEGGLSFEQRKRLSIACELAGSPSILFLDEPTSGLDSRGAMVVMRAMKRIADTGRTVCATIHQPSAAVFELFDDLLLLKKGGNTVFFGELGWESGNLINYFETLGARKIENGENPAAWMLGAYAGSDARQDIDFAEEFKKSDQYQKLRETIDLICASPDESKKITFDKVFAAEFPERLRLMLFRVFTVYKRSPAYNLTRFIIAIIYSFTIGSIFITNTWRGQAFNENQASGLIGALFLALIVTGMSSIHLAVPVMKKFRDVFYKHRASGMVSHNALALSVICCEIPFILLVSAFYFGVTALCFKGLPVSLMRFWVFFTLNTAVYSYFGQACICLLRDIPSATGLVCALIGLNVFFSGFVISPTSSVFVFAKWTAPGYAALEGLLMSDELNSNYAVIPNVGGPFFYYLNCTAGQEEPCEGDMAQYINFFFGGAFKSSYFFIDALYLVGVVFLAWILTWFSLGKFNYTNT